MLNLSARRLKSVVAVSQLRLDELREALRSSSDQDTRSALIDVVALSFFGSGRGLCWALLAENCFTSNEVLYLARNLEPGFLLQCGLLSLEGVSDLQRMLSYGCGSVDDVMLLLKESSAKSLPSTFLPFSGGSKANDAQRHFVAPCETRWLAMQRDAPCAAWALFPPLVRALLAGLPSLPAVRGAVPAEIALLLMHPVGCTGERVFHALLWLLSPQCGGEFIRMLVDGDVIAACRLIDACCQHPDLANNSYRRRLGEVLAFVPAIELGLLAEQLRGIAHSSVVSIILTAAWRVEHGATELAAARLIDVAQEASNDLCGTTGKSSSACSELARMLMGNKTLLASPCSGDSLTFLTEMLSKLNDLHAGALKESKERDQMLSGSLVVRVFALRVAAESVFTPAGFEPAGCELAAIAGGYILNVGSAAVCATKCDVATHALKALLDVGGGLLESGQCGSPLYVVASAIASDAALSSQQKTAIRGFAGLLPVALDALEAEMSRFLERPELGWHLPCSAWECCWRLHILAHPPEAALLRDASSIKMGAQAQRSLRLLADWLCNDNQVCIAGLSLPSCKHSVCSMVDRLHAVLDAASRCHDERCSAGHVGDMLNHVLRLLGQLAYSRPALAALLESRNGTPQRVGAVWTTLLRLISRCQAFRGTKTQTNAITLASVLAAETYQIYEDRSEQSNCGGGHWEPRLFVRAVAEGGTAKWVMEVLRAAREAPFPAPCDALDFTYNAIVLCQVVGSNGPPTRTGAIAAAIFDVLCSLPEGLQGVSADSRYDFAAAFVKTLLLVAGQGGEAAAVVHNLAVRNELLLFRSLLAPHPDLREVAGHLLRRDCSKSS